MNIQDDRQFELHVIKTVEMGEDGYSLTFVDGWCFWMPGSKLEPQPEMQVKLYGKGTGYPIRGMVVNGETIFYRTEEEQQIQFEQERREDEEKRRDEYKKNREDYDKRIHKLPELFQKRIHDFRMATPGWGEGYEKYELFVCEQAMTIANALKTVDRIQPFHDLDFEEQKKIVHELDDGHSGNTFGAACYMARVWMENPALIPMVHGALCPLVGCKDYGCFCSRNKENAECETSTSAISA